MGVVVAVGELEDLTKMLGRLLALFGLLTISDTVGAILGAWLLFPLRRSIPLCKSMGFFLSTVAIDQICQLIAFVGRDSNGPGRLGKWFVLWWWGGRIVHFIGLWGLIIDIVRPVKEAKIAEKREKLLKVDENA